jgi:hypothetical protein
MTTVFICHANEDLPFVQEELVGLIRALGRHPWYAEKSIRRGIWPDAIVSALKEAALILVVLSPNAATSEYVKNEVEWALARKPSQTIGVLVQDCDIDSISLGLGRVEHIDFRGDRKPAREKLIESLVLREYHGYSRKAHQEDLERIQHHLESILEIAKPARTTCLSFPGSWHGNDIDSTTTTAVAGHRADCGACHPFTCATATFTF